MIKSNSGETSLLAWHHHTQILVGMWICLILLHWAVIMGHLDQTRKEFLCTLLNHQKFWSRFSVPLLKWICWIQP